MKKRDKRRRLDSAPVLRGRVERRRLGPEPAPPADPALLRRLARTRVPERELVWRCPPAAFRFRSTRDVRPLPGLLGQRQALRAIRLGLSVPGPGYNLFLCGLAGSECLHSIERYVRSLRLPTQPRMDRIYVQNFKDPQRPRLIELPAGTGRAVQADVGAALRQIHRTLEKQKEARWRALARGVLAQRVPGLLSKYAVPALRAWIVEWRQHLLDNIHHAIAEDYSVNWLAVSESRGQPVVVEKVPTLPGLFGWIGRRPLGEQPAAPHFTEIRAGSLLAADGGVLILNASDFFSLPASWSQLKTCLKYGTLQIEDGEGGSGARGTGLRPDPIAVRVKVVLLGDFNLYDDLLESDPDFPEIFKVRVDFDSEAALTPQLLRRDLPGFVSYTCAANGLRHVTAPGMARVVEFAMRKTGRKRKVTLQSWILADLLRESDYWAARAGRRLITGADVERAVAEGILRLNLVELKIAEMIAEGTILIATSGRRIGQVNGLAIYDMGDYLFGKPSRITAETSCGQSGIINIERESGFSGRSHDKGVQILAGYLRSRFAQRRPLNLTASVCFEQSYSGVDGDSAAATEIYAILSSLSGLPVRQDIAVTGSMNQKGDMQPIGGVNEKVEGFFDCIRATRASGREGVIIPRQNVSDLMLRDDVAHAVRAGTFYIHAIDTVEEGFEILTGVAAGRRRRDGSYTPGSAFARVDERLEELAGGLKRYQPGDEH